MSRRSRLFVGSAGLGALAAIAGVGLYARRRYETRRFGHRIVWKVYPKRSKRREGSRRKRARGSRR